MNKSPHENVPHSSPAEPMRSTVTPESRSASSSGVSPKSGPGRPPSQVLPYIGHTQVASPQMAGTVHVNSPQMASTQMPPQVPNYQPPTASTSTACHLPNGTSSAMFRVQMWSNNFDSGVQSMNHSSAPSLLSMSSLRAGSQISTISEDGHSRIELTDQQQLKFENIPPNLGRGSQDGEARNAIPELLHLLRDSDEVVVQRAATMVQNIAKMDSEQPPYAEPLISGTEVILILKDVLRTHAASPNIIKPALGALFQISERRDGLESLLRVNEQTDGGLLSEIIQHIKLTGGSAIRYAILTFHTIIADKSTDGRNVERARNLNALEAVTQFIDRETNEKLLSVIVECVRLLCDKCQSQKVLFLELNGPAKLFQILRNLRYEGLLWRTTQLLKTFSNADPEAIVRCGGYEILPRQLEHASQRLITSTLECIRNMSDVPTKDIDVSMLLGKLLQLLGAVDPVVVLYCTGILSNLLANNQRNKEFLYRSDGIAILYRVLINSYNIPAQTPNQQQRVEDIQERALATLRHLCVGHPHQAEAQKAVIQTEFAAEFLLRKLTEMRPSILKQTLQILNKAALQDINLPILRDTRIREVDANFVERILLILKVACEQLPSTQMVEEVKVAELIQLSLSTLQLLCRDPQLMNQVAFFVRRQDYLFYRDPSAPPVLLPIFCLYQGYVEDENLKRSALGLISELALHPDMASLYAMDGQLMSTFQHYSRSRNQAFATYAEQAYERSVQGANPSMNFPNGGTSTVRPIPPPGSGHSSIPYAAQYPATHPQYAGPAVYGPSNSYSDHHMQYPHHGHPSDQYQSSHEASLQPHTPMTAPSVQPHMPAAYGREGPSFLHCSQQPAMDCSSEPWPEDLSGLSISDDPFATMFCSQPIESPQQRTSQQQQLRPIYSTGGRGHDSAPAGMYCSPGPPSSMYDQPMESMHMGSPEAPASWHDPNAAYINYQM